MSNEPITPLPHQKVEAEFLLEQTRGLLASETGTGKTITAGLIA